MLIDSHCHFHPELRQDELEEFIDILNKENPFELYLLHLMTTQHVDLDYMDFLLSNLNNSSVVVPYFGVHPWFSHLFTFKETDKLEHYRSVLKPEPSIEVLEKLPNPINIQNHITKIKQIITKHKLEIFGFGEIGLDKLFKIPNNGYLGNLNYPNDKKLSICKVDLNHQILVLKQFLLLANEFNKPVSLHCVKAHGALYDTILNEFSNLTIILHSYTGSIDQAKLWIKNKSNLYFSLSNWINGEKNVDLLKTILEPTQILIETDIYLDKLFISNQQQEYFKHLQGIYNKLQIDSKQLYNNMLKLINL